MDYIRKFLELEEIIGQGSFGKVLATSLIQNSRQQSPSPLQPQSQQLEQRQHQQAFQKQLLPIGSINHSPPIKVLTTTRKYDPSQRRFALKCIHPLIRPRRLASELKYLRELGGECNIVKMHSAHFHEGALFIVMDLIEHDRFIDFVVDLKHDEIRSYLRKLLEALEHMHKRNIMHRDIKPANVLFNRKDKKLLLVDLGLAQYVPSRAILQSPAKRSIKFTPTASPTTPNISTKRLIQPTTDTNVPTRMLKRLRVSTNDDVKEPVKLTVGAYESPVTHNHNTTPTSARNHISNQNHQFSTPKIPRQLATGRCGCLGRPRICSKCRSRPESIAPRSGTPGFKAPETLLRYTGQSTAVDIWAAGVILASLLAGHHPIFRDVDDLNSLCDIIAVVGSQKMIAAAEKMEIRLIFKPSRESVSLAQLCRRIRKSNDGKRQIDFPDAPFQLLERMLDPDPTTRITATDALAHPWLGKSY